MRRWHLGSMALAVLLAAWAASAGPSLDEIATALERVWAAGDYQRSLPEPAPLAPIRVRPPPDLGFLADLLPILRVLAWVAIIVVVVVVALPLLRWLRRRLAAAARTAEPPLATPGPTAAAAEPLRDDMPFPADRLAAEGRIAEAVHALLLASIRALTATTAIDLRAALTSREIAQQALAGSGRRTAFSTIARAVEISRFGGRALGAETYQACRHAFLSLAGAHGG